MALIKDFREGDRLSQVVLCKYKQLGTARNGKNYYALSFQDKTGIVDAKIWDLGPGIDHFEALDYIYIDGEVTSFNGALQINVKRVRKASEGEYVPADFFPCSKRDAKQMYEELLEIIAQVKNTYLNQLLQKIFVDDHEFIKRFKEHSAAKSVHHNFIGGLLEHTLNVTKIAKNYITIYPEMSEDLLVTAALCHDIGKVHELSSFPENDYTDDGQLIGHIIIGYEIISNHIKSIAGFPKKTASELRHCLLAHHGKLEFGSPKKPMIIEAMALNLADEADAKIMMFSSATEDLAANEWKYNRFVENNIRKTNT